MSTGVSDREKTGIYLLKLWRRNRPHLLNYTHKTWHGHLAHGLKYQSRAIPGYLSTDDENDVQGGADIPVCLRM